MDASILLGDEISEQAAAVSEALYALGLVRRPTDCFDDEVLDALNVYRTSNALVPLDFADPTALRALGLPADGDEVLSLAAYAEAHADTEVGMYDACVRVLGLCRAHALTVYEYTKMSGCDGISPEALTAAILAYLR